MTAKPSYEELERRIHELEKIESEYKSSQETLQKNERSFKMFEEINEINRISNFVGSTLDLEEVLRRILENVIESVNSSVGMIFLTNAVKGNITWGASLGLSEQFVNDFKETPIRIGEGLTGTIAQTGKPIFIQENSSNDPRIVRPVVVKENLNSFLGVPIFVADKVVGVMNILTRPPVKLEERDKHFCSAVGSQVGLAIINAKKYSELKKMEKVLKESEALFRGMFKDHSAVMLLIDPDAGQIIKANQAAVQYYGYPLEKMLQMKIQQLNVLSPAEITEQMRCALNKQANIFEFQHLLSDGQIRDVEVHSSPITIQHQTLLFSIISDITERKQAEAKLRNSEERIRTIGDNLQGAQLYQFRVAPEGGAMFTYVSSKVEDLHEYKPEEVLKDASLLFNRVHPEDVDGWQKLTKKALKELTIYDHTVRIVRKSGEIRWHRMISKPRKLDDGSVLFDGVELDVTEGKQLEEALRESLTRYDELVANVPVGVYVFWIRATGHLEFEYVSDRWCEIHQVKREDVLSDATNVNNLVHPDDRDDFLVRNQESFLKRIPFVWEGRFLIGDGKLRWLRIESTPILFDNGDIRCFGVTWDITDRKQVEEAMQESESQISSILRSAPVGIGSVVNRVLIKVNKHMCEMTGYDETELIGQSSRMLYPSDEDFEFVGSKKYAQIADHGTGTVETRWQKKDGTIIDVFLSSTPVDLKDHSKGVTFTALDITEGKKAEKALLESEDRFKKLSSFTFEGIVIHNNAIAIDVNQSFVRMLGYEREEIIGMNLFKLIHPDDHETTKVNLSKQVATPYEIRAIRKDGSTFFAEIEARNIFYNNEFFRVACVRDITERKQAEQDLEKSLALIDAIMDSLEEGLLVVNMEGKVIRHNRAFIDLWKIPPELESSSDEMLLEHVVSQLVDPTAFLSKVRQLYDAPEKSSFDEIACADGRMFERYSQPHWQGSQINGRVWCFRDITNRKQAEEALRESEQRYRTILNEMAEGYHEVDLAGNFTFFNDAFLNLFGYSSEEMIGTNFSYYAAEESIVKEVYQTYNEIYITGNPVQRTEWNIIRKDGQRRTLEYSAAVVRDSENVPNGFRGIARDITERKQAEIEREKLQTLLNQAQKMESVGRLAGGVAHDFNNMLGVILGHTELALLRTDDKQKLCSDLNEIQKAAERSADITKKLLAFARKQTISPKQIDLNDTVESMLNMLRRLIGEDIDLVWNPSKRLWPVKVDSTQIDQILVNLCVNARDAISAVGKLIIETEIKSFDEEYCKEHPGFIPGDYVLLAVSDNGCGMDKEILENLFEPFFTTKEVGKGTGLGLATVYGIVKQNNGFINVYSEPGQGSTFKIYLPRLVSDEDTDKAVPEKKVAAGGTETILLVEDEPTILRMTRMMLERKGYLVIPAATPGEALEKAEAHSGTIDLLMTDVVMPEMNGRDLAGKISALYPAIRRLFMSGYTADVIAHQGVLDEGVAFIQKPFSMADMTEKVRDILDTVSDEN